MGSSPAAATALLFAADEQRFEPGATPHDQRAGARHATEFVGTDADQVGVERAEVASARGRRRPRRRRAPRPRRCGTARPPRGRVGASRPRGCPTGSAPARGAARSGPPERSRSASTSSRPCRRRRWSRLAPARAEASRTAECSTAAHSTGAPGHGTGGPPDRGVDRLGRPRGEDDLAGHHAEQVRHLCPRRLERVADGAALFVDTAGIAGWKRRPSGPTRRGLRAAAGVVLAWSR